MDNRDQRGNTAIVLAILLVVLLGFTAMVVDVGYLAMAQAQLQAAADASALGGAQRLDLTDAGMDNARGTAVTIGTYNEAAGQTFVLDPASDVELGVYDHEDGTFTPSSEADEVNAVRVEKVRDDLTPFFSAVAFNTDRLTGRAVSIAALPPPERAGEVECFLPLALPSCTFDIYDMDELNDIEFSFTDDTSDNIGWGMLGTSPNANNLGDQLGDCTDAGPVGVEDDVYLNNGEITAALQDLIDAIEASQSIWDDDKWGTQPAAAPQSGISPSQYGSTLEGPIVVYEEEDCENPKFTGTAPVSGFVWGAVYDVVSKGGDKNVRMRVEVLDDYDWGTGGGGDIDAGVTYTGPARLAQ